MVSYRFSISMTNDAFQHIPTYPQELSMCCIYICLATSTSFIPLDPLSYGKEKVIEDADIPKGDAVPFKEKESACIHE